MRNSPSPLYWDSGEGGGEVSRNITSRHLYYDKMDGLLDLKADLTVYEVGITNTHTGVDEDPPRDYMFYFLKICWEFILFILLL